MTQTLFAKDLSLYDLHQQFGLVESDHNPCDRFPLPTKIPLSNFEEQVLQRIRHNFHSLIQRQSLSEETVKMVVVAPLLDLAGFYEIPLTIATEKSIKLTIKEGNLTLKGKIDILVLANQFWVLVIEAKQVRFDVTIAIPQAIVYMLAAPQSHCYGLLTNGREFLFVEVQQHPQPTYALSPTFSINKPEADLAIVLQHLRTLKQISHP